MTQWSDKKRNENIYYKKSRCCRGEELNEADDNGSVTTVYGGSSWFENADSVEDHGVNASKLLKEHDSQGNAEWYQNGSF